MEFSNFEFLKTPFPKLYRLAYMTEDLIFEDPYVAMINMKQLTNEMIVLLSQSNQLMVADKHNDGIIHYLWRNGIIAEDIYLVLREIELFDIRESEILVDTDRIDFLFCRVYDFILWFYTTYVDQTYVVRPFVQRKITSSSVAVINQLEESSNHIHAFISVDENDYSVDGESLVTLQNYECIQYENGESYEGQLVRAMKHGKGKYTWQDGTVYMGHWKKDLEHGSGEKLYANGDLYRGDWKNGVFDGKGIYRWQDGTIYEGQWQDGFQHGYGTITKAGGTINKGFWTYGEFVHTTDQLSNGKE